MTAHTPRARALGALAAFDVARLEPRDRRRAAGARPSARRDARAPRVSVAPRVGTARGGALGLGRVVPGGRRVPAPPARGFRGPHAGDRLPHAPLLHFSFPKRERIFLKHSLCLWKRSCQSETNLSKSYSCFLLHTNIKGTFVPSLYAIQEKPKIASNSKVKNAAGFVKHLSTKMCCKPASFPPTSIIVEAF